MLFISPHPQYQLLGITHEVVQYHPTNGRAIGTTPGINAEFFHGGSPNWALEQALGNTTFQGAWHGLPDGVDYRAYVSSFNTEDAQAQLGWDDETREYVEEFMLKHQDYGSRYVLAVPPEAVADLPWPTYPETHHSRIVILAEEIGVPFEEVLAYEVRNKNRPFVVRELEKAVGSNPAPVDAELVPA